MLRERPVEAEVDVAFQESDEIADALLRDKAWDEYIARLHASESPLPGECQRLGIEIGDLREAFHTYAEYPDVDEWPAPEVDPPDFAEIKVLLKEVAAHVDGIRPRFPVNRADWVELMRTYDRVRRMIRLTDFREPTDFVAILRQFTMGDVKPYEQWTKGEREAREEAGLWKQFRDRAADFLKQWRKHSYPTCMRALAGARLVYDELREAAGLLNFQDLLLKAAALLKDKPEIRRYFRGRFTRILVDEFQDTDPIQAQVMILLTADNENETDWHKCRPLPGSLFVVGDPKQSIYRFRRADIVTYNTVKEIIARHGTVVQLQTNFRSTGPLIGWINRTFEPKFPVEQTPQAPTYVELKPAPGREVAVDGSFQSGSPLPLPLVGQALQPAGGLESPPHRGGDESKSLSQLPTARGGDLETLSPSGRGQGEGGISTIVPREMSAPMGGISELPSVQVLRIPETVPAEEIPAYEAELIARAIRKAVDSQMTLPHSNRVVQPEDFLIITRRRKNLAIFSRQLQEKGLAHEITGGDAVNQSRELGLLHVCLSAVTQPDDSVALVAALRSELFGISDSALYDFKMADGVFSYAVPIPIGLANADADLFADAFNRLNKYARWIRTMPPVAAVEKMIADLGLAAASSLDADGNIRAGSLFKAVELLRSGQVRGWTVSGLVEYLGGLLELKEKHDGIPALPSENTGVRVMNLHQVKGLEAPVVFLADTTGETVISPTIHIDRSGRTVKGYLAVRGRRFNGYSASLALPADWDKAREVEKTFELAERDRLMYVAATRAGAQLTISQRVKSKQGRNQDNPWKYFYDTTDDCQPMLDPGRVGGIHQEQPLINEAAYKDAEAEIAARWDTVKAPSYVVAGVKAFTAAGTAVPLSGVEHGTEWGSVIHALLQAAMIDPAVDLECLAQSLVAEQDLGAEAVEEAVTTVRSVMASEIWRRAMNSTQRLVETPFQIMKSTDGSPDALLRGVIDLTFREHAGWVIVDYKTDRRPESELRSLVERYQEQVRLYAESWASITGEPVCEIGLYFTHLGRYVRC
jgi:ATP-dependent exoDNAse (exonuclease V) beta subunit